MLGGTITGTSITTTLSGITRIASIGLSNGVWNVTANVRFTAPGTFAELSIGVSQTVINYNAASVAVGVNGMVLQSTLYVSTGVLITYNLLANAQANGTISNVVFNAIRVA